MMVQSPPIFEHRPGCDDARADALRKPKHVERAVHVCANRTVDVRDLLISRGCGEMKDDVNARDIRKLSDLFHGAAVDVDLAPEVEDTPHVGLWVYDRMHVRVL